MIWLFERAAQAIRIETRFDRASGEYALVTEERNGTRETERFRDAAAFRLRLKALEQQLESKSLDTDRSFPASRWMEALIPSADVWDRRQSIVDSCKYPRPQIAGRRDVRRRRASRGFEDPTEVFKRRSAYTARPHVDIDHPPFRSAQLVVQIERELIRDVLAHLRPSSQRNAAFQERYRAHRAEMNGTAVPCPKPVPKIGASGDDARGLDHDPVNRRRSGVYFGSEELWSLRVPSPC